MNNFEGYKKALEIDYFAYFAKAYFAFNYYLKHKINDANDDRLRIDKIKEKSNLSVKFKDLIQRDIFYNNFIDLRNALASNEIQNEGKPLTFDKVKMHPYREEILCDDTYYRIKYFIKIQNSGKIVIQCGDAEQIVCQFEEIEQQLQNNRNINAFQSKRILSIIQERRNQYIININNVIDNIEKYKIKIEETKSDNEREKSRSELTDEYEKLYKAFIEIIYTLRNALFHSEIDINNTETKIAYEKAYWLLREFLTELS